MCLIRDKITFDQVRKAYDMEEDDETGMENFRIKVVDHPLLNWHLFARVRVSWQT